MKHLYKDRKVAEPTGGRSVESLLTHINSVEFDRFDKFRRNNQGDVSQPTQHRRNKSGKSVGSIRSSPRSMYKDLINEYLEKKGGPGQQDLSNKAIGASGERERTKGSANKERRRLEALKKAWFNPPKQKMLIDQLMKREGERLRREKQGREVLIKQLLREFDEQAWGEGPQDIYRQQTFRQSLREHLLDYLRRGCVTGDLNELRSRDLVVEGLDFSLKRILELLTGLAEKGNKLALSVLADRIIPIVSLINREADREPSSIQPLAAQLASWPVLKSLHPLLDSPHEEFLNKLKVGSKHPFVCDRSSKWKPNDSLGRWAVHLCIEIALMWEGEYVDESSPPWVQSLVTLAAFGPDTWEDWWKVAGELLQDKYIDVVQIPELRECITNESDRSSLSSIRKRIRQRLRDKFCSLAGANKDRER